MMSTYEKVIITLLVGSIAWLAGIFLLQAHHQSKAADDKTIEACGRYDHCPDEE